MSRTPVISCTEVVKRFDGRTVLDGVTLDVDAGETVVVMGGSGCGKSTFLRLLIGSLQPDAGRIKLFGHDIAHMDQPAFNDVRKRFGILFQSGALFNSMTLAENVALPMLLGGTADRDAAGRARAALAEVGLADRADHFPEEMSGGEQQRTAIARALAVRPSLLLADEPTGNLDSETGGEVLRLLRGLTADGTRSIVMVTHDEQAARIGDRRVRLRDGRIEREE